MPKGNKNGNRTRKRKSDYKLERIQSLPGASEKKIYSVSVNPNALPYHDPDGLQRKAAPYLAAWFAQSDPNTSPSYFKTQILKAVLYYVENNPELADIDVQTSMIFDESEIIADVVAERVLDGVKTLLKNLPPQPTLSSGVEYSTQELDEDTLEFFTSFIEEEG